MKDYSKRELRELAEECAQCIITCSLDEKETAQYLFGIFKEKFTGQIGFIEHKTTADAV